MSRREPKDEENCKQSQVTDTPKDAKDVELYTFDGHGCLDGDCPHEKLSDCLNEAFKAGYAAREPEVERIKKEKSVNVSDYFNVADKLTKANALIEKLEGAVKFYANNGTLSNNVAKEALAQIAAYRSGK